MDDKERWEQVCEPAFKRGGEDIKRMEKTVREEVESVRTPVNKLLKAVLEGNGKPGLLARVAITEDQLEGLAKSQQVQPFQPGQGKTYFGVKGYIFGNVFLVLDKVLKIIIAAILLMLASKFAGIDPDAFIHAVELQNRIALNDRQYNQD